MPQRRYRQGERRVRFEDDVDGRVDFIVAFTATDNGRLTANDFVL